MSVETSAKSLLVKVVSNETNTAAQHEETVQYTHLEVVFCLFGAEGTTIAHKIDKADSDSTVDVQDKVILLRGRD